MNYALVQNNNVIAVGLPKVGTLKDGTKTNTFDQLDQATLKELGWIPIEDAGVPVFDKTIKQVEVDVVVGADKVTVTYLVKDKEAPVKEQLESLRSTLQTKGILSAADVANTKKPKTVGT